PEPDRGALRLPARRDHRALPAAAPDLPADRRLRSLRPARPRPALGAHGPRAQAGPRGRSEGSARLAACPPGRPARDVHALPGSGTVGAARRSDASKEVVMANSDLTMRPAATSWGAVLGGWVATIGASVIFAPVVAGLLVVPGTPASG